MSPNDGRDYSGQPEFSTGRSDRVEKVREKAIETYEMPVYPKLSLILLISMSVLTAAISLVDIRNFLLYGDSLGLLHLLLNVSMSALTCWGIYSVLLVPVCLLGMLSNTRSYAERKRLSGIADKTEEERSRSRRAVRRLNAQFRLYLTIDLAVLLILGAMFLIVRAFPH